MAEQVNRAAIRQLVRLQGELRGRTSNLDSDLNLFINQALKDLWIELVHGHDGFGVDSQPTNLNTVADTAYVALPADFLSLRRVRRTAGNGLYQDIGSIDLVSNPAPEGNRSQEPALPGAYYLDQPLMSSNPRLVLTPIPTGIEVIKIWYARTAPQYVDDSGTFDMVLGFEDYLVQQTIARATHSAQWKQLSKQLASEYLERIRNQVGRRDHGPDYVAKYVRRGGVRYPSGSGGTII